MSDFFVRSITLQDIRCFHGEAKITLKNPTIFVGGNDSGKSSIFKVLDVFFNRLELKKDTVDIEDKYVDFLMPKYCEKAHSARRITVEIESDDKRKLRGMIDDSTGTARLILTVRKKACKLELNRCHRGAESDRAAINLYERVKKFVSYVYIPSLRDVSGDVFGNNLESLLIKKVFEKIYPQQVGGTPAGYRQIKNFIEKYKNELKKIANSELLESIRSNIPIAASQDISFDVDMNESEILKWSLGKIKIVRPARGGGHVGMLDMGTGVLSSLSLAILFTNKVMAGSDKLSIIAIEEPEAFVHPHYQRSLFGRLLKNVGKNQLLVSTHSPAIIDRQAVGNISIVTREDAKEGSKIWQVNDIKVLEEEISTAHANFSNSELFFSDLVIFVEGNSEKLVLTYLFEKLPADIKDLFAGITIIEVGGNAHFGPFIRLMKSFGKAGKEFPIRWLVFTDRDSIQPGGGQPVFRALRESGYSNIKFDEINVLLADRFVDDSDGLLKINNINDRLGAAKCFVNLSDLEYSLLTSHNLKNIGLSWEAEKQKKLITGSLPDDLRDALIYIGSKGLNLDQTPSETGKKPFIHGKIMKWTKLSEVAEIYRYFLLRISEELNIADEYKQRLSEELGILM